MIQEWIDKLQALGGLKDTGGDTDKQSIESLTALLLVEIARSDTTIETVELSAIREALLSSSTAIDAQAIDSIIDNAIKDADTAVSLHTQLRQINIEFTHEQKTSLVRQMWVVAMADGNLDAYEEHMIRQISDLLYLSHTDYIQAKLAITESDDKTSQSK